VRGQSDGGAITSDAGGLLLREVEKGTGIIRRLADCFVIIAIRTGSSIGSGVDSAADLRGGLGY